MHSGISKDDCTVSRNNLHRNSQSSKLPLTASKDRRMLPEGKCSCSLKILHRHLVKANNLNCCGRLLGAWKCVSCKFWLLERGGSGSHRADQDVVQGGKSRNTECFSSPDNLYWNYLGFIAAFACSLACLAVIPHHFR